MTFTNMEMTRLNGHPQSPLIETPNKQYEYSTVFTEQAKLLLKDVPEEYLKAFMPRPCYFWEMTLIVSGLALTISDVMTDLLLASDYYEHNEYLYSWLTYSFFAAGSLYELSDHKQRTNLSYRKWYHLWSPLLSSVFCGAYLYLQSSNKYNSQSILSTLVTCLMFAFIASVFGRIILENLRASHTVFELTRGLKREFHVADKHPTNCYTTAYEYSLLTWDFKLRRLYEAFGESAPQLCFQMYVMYATKETGWLQIMTIATSLVSFTLRVVNVIRHSDIKFYEIDPSMTRDILIFLLFFFEIGARVIVLSMGFAGFLDKWVPLAIGLFLLRPSILTFIKWKSSQADLERTYAFFVLIFVSSLFISDEFLFLFVGRYPKIGLSKSIGSRCAKRNRGIIRDRLLMVFENLIVIAIWISYNLNTHHVNIEFWRIAMVFGLFQVATLVFMALKRMFASHTTAFFDNSITVDSYYQLLLVYLRVKEKDLQNRALEVLKNTANYVPIRKSLIQILGRFCRIRCLLTNPVNHDQLPKEIQDLLTIKDLETNSHRTDRLLNKMSENCLGDVEKCTTL